MDPLTESAGNGAGETPSLATSPTPRPGFDLDAAWALHPQVAVRPEPFGALLYHFGTRRLSFLKDPTLRVIVESLAAHPNARTALAAAVPSADDADAPPAITSALSTLAATGMIVER